MSMAKGLLPDDRPQSVAAARSLALSQADVGLLVGARLNWLLGHGEPPHWAPDALFIQADIEASEMDSNQPIEAPLVGDIGAVMEALNSRGRAQPGRITAPAAWRAELATRKARHTDSMPSRLAADPTPMR